MVVGGTEYPHMKISSPFLRKLHGRIVALSVSCPDSECNPEECPFHEVRKMSLRERYQWSKTLSEDEALRLVQHHIKCVEEKTGNTLS